jgi:hypothetical protein
MSMARHVLSIDLGYLGAEGRPGASEPAGAAVCELPRRSLDRPRVIIHNLIGLDGRLDGFPADAGLYYMMASRLPHQAVLTGSGTMLAVAVGQGIDLSARTVEVQPSFWQKRGDRPVPEQIFDFVLGMNRWVLRVAGYAGLMTDQYPPFRLDMGGHDPGTLTLPPAALQDLPEAADLPPADLPPAPRSAPGRWTGGRIASVVAGAVLVLCSVGLFGGSGVALWAQASRHGGYADLATATYGVPGYALTSEQIGLHLATGVASDLIGTVRIRVTPVSGTAPAFVGIAPAGAAARYLAGVDYATVRGAAGGHGTYTEHPGSAPAVPPRRAGIWAAQAAGPGTQTLTWTVRSGDWTVVAMNTDGSRPVSLRVNVAATLPALPWIAVGLLTGGIIFVTGGVLLIAIPLRRASRH